MRKYLPLIALVVALVGLSLWRVDYAFAHSWFSFQKNPVTGYGCCSGSDCHLIETEDWYEEKGVIYVTYNGRLWSIPADQAQPSQDKEGKAAACIWGNQLRCFFTPALF